VIPADIIPRRGVLIQNLRQVSLGRLEYTFILSGACLFAHTACWRRGLNEQNEPDDEWRNS
jgi:hypothetical protein